MEGIWNTGGKMRQREQWQQVLEAGKPWVLRENIKWLNVVASAILHLDQVTKHLESMMLSAKQEAICRALWNNEILIPLKKKE